MHSSLSGTASDPQTLGSQDSSSHTNVCSSRVSSTYLESTLGCIRMTQVRGTRAVMLNLATHWNLLGEPLRPLVLKSHSRPNK